MKTFTDQDLIGILESRVAQDGLRPTARALGFSAPLVQDVINGRRGVSERMAGTLGFLQIPPLKPKPRKWRLIPKGQREPTA